MRRERYVRTHWSGRARERETGWYACRCTILRRQLVPCPIHLYTSSTHAYDLRMENVRYIVYRAASPKWFSPIARKMRIMDETTISLFWWQLAGRQASRTSRHLSPILKNSKAHFIVVKKVPTSLNYPSFFEVVWYPKSRTAPMYSRF